MNNFRVSYFYLYDENIIYYPKYLDEGLKYRDLYVPEFEHRFIRSRISTAIDETGTAKDESLHEIEYINNKFRDENGNVKDVKLYGCIWIKEDADIEKKKIDIDRKEGIYINSFNIIKELILSGESKYGFGHVVFDSFDNNVNFSVNSFEKENPDCLFVNISENENILSRLKYSKEIPFKGDIELLSGRSYYDPEKMLILKISKINQEVVFWKLKIIFLLDSNFKKCYGSFVRVGLIITLKICRPR